MFFFSSRRRHTRLQGDWSSDVCSSDLLPAGADTVVRQEDTEPAESGRIRVVTGRDARKNVRYRGEDIRKGDVVLGAGTPLGPAQLGVLASIAHATPLVYDAPRVAFMGSGDEIVDLDRADDILSGKKVATSNSYTLRSEEHTSELQSPCNLVCRLLLEKK